MRELVDLLPIVLIALFLWLSGLTYAFWRLLTHYRKIALKARGGDLVRAMEELLDSEKKNSTEIKKLAQEVLALSKKQLVPMQKLGLIRFNPFNETGGDQSFCLCLLDGEGNGFLLTTLHTRDRTRVYTKPVSRGKSKFELSLEESRALSEALK